MAAAAAGGLVLLALLTAALALQTILPGAGTAARLDGESLFTLTNVWRIALTFEPDQWDALEPRQGRGLFGGFGGPPGGPGGQRDFGPAPALVPLILTDGDLNRNGSLSRDEFAALSERWFAAWDTNSTGELNATAIGAGLNKRLESGLPGRLNGPATTVAAAFTTPSRGNRNGFPKVHAGLEFEGWRFEDVAVRYKGNNTFMTSRNSLKRPLKVDLNGGVKGRRLGSVTELNLHNNVNDPGMMNEPLSYRLFRDAGVPASRTGYSQVYLNVPGKYTNHFLGVYSLVENLDNDFLRSRFGTKRGALFKPTTRQLFEDMGDNWADYQMSYAPKTMVYDYQAKRVIEFSKLVSHANDAEFATRLEEFLDLDEFARFMAVTVWLSNMDSLLCMAQNYYVHLHPKTQQFQFLPWDFDHSFGQFPMAGSPQELEQLSLLQPWTGRVLFLERVFKVEKFKRLYLDRMKEFAGTIFQPERIQRQVDELAAVLRPSVSKESSQLVAQFDRVVKGESGAGMGFGGPPPGAIQPSSSNGSQAGQMGPRNNDASEPRFGGPGRGRFPFGPGGFGQAIKPIRTFVVARAASVNDQLLDKSQGAKLSRSGPGGPFGGPGGPGGPGGAGGPRGPGGPPGMGGPGGIGPGLFLAQAFLTALDIDKNGVVTRKEFTQGFQKWFDSWSTDGSGALTAEQLLRGISRDLSPFRGGPPGGFGFGPPPGAFGPPPGVFGPPPEAFGPPEASPPEDEPDNF